MKPMQQSARHGAIGYPIIGPCTWRQAAPRVTSWTSPLWGGRPFATHCLIKYTGRKSGKTFITPLCYADIGGEVVICASKGGADHHPAWYLNLREQPHVDFQIATQAFRATWREPEGAEREKVWSFLVDCHPFYTGYQTSTRRTLPLVMMKAAEPIRAFSEADLSGVGEG